MEIYYYYYYILYSIFKINQNSLNKLFYFINIINFKI